MSKDLTFGSFIREKRLALKPYISLRKMAELIDIVPSYMSTIETGYDSAPSEEILSDLARVLRLDKQDQTTMYELAAKSKTYTAIPEDLPEYISANEYARIALRVAKDLDATDSEWIEFIEKLKQRGQQSKEEQDE